MQEQLVTDGVLVVDKPATWTSHDVVAKMRSITKVKKVGHTGTLDPFATGVLPLTLGRATRLTNHFLSSDKTYHGVMRFGFATTTFDIDGEATSEDSAPKLQLDRLREMFSRYIGDVVQTLPPYSAKKIRGKPLYAYARRGIDMGAQTKRIHIDSLQLISVDGSEAEFDLVCSAGTYARSLAHDMGREYGSGAHLVRLRRTRSGEFPADASVSLNDDGSFHPREYFLSRAIPLKDLLSEIPAIVVTPAERQKILHGTDLNLLTASQQSEEYRLVDEAGNLIAIGRRQHTFPPNSPQPVQWVRVHPYIILVQG